ncbi:hypothetical protein F4861DRAFT_223130 [Xylaria intraflava]|nr:hypothetical protein F4861DRAFT_223130 [Xylaria intraflava]
MAAITHKRVLLAGFVPGVAAPASFYERFGSGENVKTELIADHARITRAGITPVVFHLDPSQQEKHLKDFEAHLQEGKYDAIIIGAGVRVHPDYTVLFETLVNLCHTVAPNIPLLFNDGPSGSSKALERVFKVPFE